MAAEEEMVSLISTTPVKALGSAADIVVQLLRFLNDTHISSATGRVVKGVSGAAASAGKGAYNAATRGIEGLGREGTVSMHVLRRVADEAGIDSRLVPVPRDFMGALAKEHNLDDDAMWSVVKKRLTEAGIMHAVVRTSAGLVRVRVEKSVEPVLMVWAVFLTNSHSAFRTQWLSVWNSTPITRTMRPSASHSVSPGITGSPPT